MALSSQYDQLKNNRMLPCVIFGKIIKDDMPENTSLMEQQTSFNRYIGLVITGCFAALLCFFPQLDIINNVQLTVIGMQFVNSYTHFYRYLSSFNILQWVSVVIFLSSINHLRASDGDGHYMALVEYVFSQSEYKRSRL